MCELVLVTFLQLYGGVDKGGVKPVPHSQTFQLSLFVREKGRGGKGKEKDKEDEARGGAAGKGAEGRRRREGRGGIDMQAEGRTEWGGGRRGETERQERELT